MGKQDEDNLKNIDQNARKLKRLQKGLNHWRTKMANNVKECEDRNKALKEEKDAIAYHFQLLKSKMNKFREKQTASLTELSQNTNTCITTLTKKIKTVGKCLFG